MTGADRRERCGWAGPDQIYLDYHDDEWGRPVTDDTALFEKICLEGFQSGLSWITILRRRAGFREAFAGFDPLAVSAFDDTDIDRLLGDAAIIRHRGKITAAIANASATLAVQAQFGSLAAFIWSFEPDRDRPAPHALGDVAATAPESVALAKALKRHGFRYVGPTTAYAAMQSLGLVNDHLGGCFARDACEQQRVATEIPQLTKPLS